MKIAIMQPYFFPYIGYFQLINAVDKFIFYDDVAFIKQGWINRNNILLSGKAFMISLPLKKISSFQAINEIYVSDKPAGWPDKLINTLRHAYSKAPYFQQVFSMIERIIRTASGRLISDVAKDSVVSTMAMLDIKTPLICSSSIYNNTHLKSEKRIIDICEQEKSNVYINSIGGIELYKKEDFISNQKELLFIKSCVSNYNQYKNGFSPNLSIIDVMMFNNCSVISEMLNSYELIC